MHGDFLIFLCVCCLKVLVFNVWLQKDKKKKLNEDCRDTSYRSSNSLKLASAGSGVPGPKPWWRDAPIMTVLLSGPLIQKQQSIIRERTLDIWRKMYYLPPGSHKHSCKIQLELMQVG